MHSKIQELDYKSLYRDLPEAVVISDSLTGRIIDCNNAAERLIGRARSEIIGMHQAGLYPGAKSEETYAQLVSLAKKGQVHNRKSEVLTKRGEKIPVVINASHANLKGMDAVIQVFTCTTPQESSKEVASPRELGLHTAFNATHDLMIVVDLQFNIIDINQQAITTLRLPEKKAALSHKCFEVLRGRRETCTGCIVAEVYNARRPISRTSPDELEFAPGGKCFEISAYPINDDKGNVVGAIEYHREVTERLRLEKALKESESKYQTVAKQPREGAVIAQLDPPRILFASSSVEKISGYTSAELTSLSPEGILDMLYPKDRAEFMALSKDIAEGKELQEPWEFCGETKEGSPLLIALSSRRIQYNGQPAFLATLTDITY